MVHAFLAAISPVNIQVATRVMDQIEQELVSQRRQRELQLEQARYEARLAQRQYDAVDPSNRLVAAELERRWNEKLERVAELERAFAQAERDAEWKLTTEERAAITDLSSDLPALWIAETTTNQERKQLLRMVIESVQVDGVTQTGQIEVQIRWRSGTITVLTVRRAAPGECSLKTPEDAVSRIHKLAPQRQSQQETVVEVCRIVDPVFIQNERIGERTDFQKAVPVGGVSGQARDFEPQHDAGATHAHFGYQFLKAFPVCGGSSRLSQVAIDHDGPVQGPTQRDGTLPQCILTFCTFRVFEDLPDRRLPDVQVSVALQVASGYFLRIPIHHGHPTSGMATGYHTIRGIDILFRNRSTSDGPQCREGVLGGQG